MVTEIISKKGQVNLPAYCAEDAIKHFKEIITAWYDGMRCPLPLAIKSAFAWLRALPNETGVILLDVERGNDAARKVYEPSTQSQGELGENPYLRRAWPRFDCLIESGEFARLSERLLRPIHNAISKKHTKVNDHE
jgi:exodeoxyribonuclease V gamma subunit